MTQSGLVRPAIGALAMVTAAIAPLFAQEHPLERRLAFGLTFLQVADNAFPADRVGPRLEVGVHRTATAGSRLGLRADASFTTFAFSGVVAECVPAVPCQLPRIVSYLASATAGPTVRPLSRASWLELTVGAGLDAARTAREGNTQQETHVALGLHSGLVVRRHRRFGLELTYTGFPGDLTQIRSHVAVVAALMF